MKQGIYTVIENKPLTKDIVKMVLEGDTSAITNPGQFINIKINGLFLRRPISVCDCEGDKITIIYKVVGKGTLALKNISEGERLDILTGLGNGYNIANAGENPLLLGGGVGLPPMYMLAKLLVAKNKKVTLLMGFNKAEEIFYKEEFEKLGVNVTVCTVDGSFGKKGFITDHLPENYSYFFVCGPEGMLKAVYNSTKTSGQFSFEERMGCGFGACMGCSCKTLYGNKRICKDGPVLVKEEIIWEK